MYGTHFLKTTSNPFSVSTSENGCTGRVVPNGYLVPPKDEVRRFTMTVLVVKMISDYKTVELLRLGGHTKN